MRSSLVKKAGEISKHAAGKANAPHKQVYRALSTVPHHWQPHYKGKVQNHSYAQDAHRQDQDYYDHSSFESTLDRVLEMTQLGKEQSLHWENVVRSAYKTEYEMEENVCHVCGGPKVVDALCQQCVDANA